MRDRIRAARFALHEVRLYLDTHPDDERAKREYKEREEKVLAAEKEYALRGCAEKPWISDPWPWDFV